MDEHDIIQMEITGQKPNSTGWWRIRCPYCVLKTGKPDLKGSLAVSARTGKYTCWKCSEQGFVSLEYEGETEFEPEETTESRIGPPEGFAELYDGEGYTCFALNPARRYMASRLRGFTLAFHVGSQVGIGACAYGPRKNRIIVPVTNPNGEWVGWVGRDWTNKSKLRYVYPPGMTRVLFNRQALQYPGYPYVLVVEGVFDALPYWPNVVACLGKPSDQQVEELKQAKSPIVVAFDGDAHEEGWALASRLRMANVEAQSVRLPPGEDPGSVAKEWLQEEAFRVVGV